MSKTIYSSIAILYLIFSGLLFFNNIPHVRASTLYYNAVIDTDWNTTGNWWADAGFSVPGSVPVVSDDVVISGNVGFNTGPAASVNTMTVGDSAQIAIPVTVSSGATFNDSSLLSGGTISGNVTFNDSSWNNVGTILGNATFNDSSYDVSGTVSGNAIFNYASGGTITLGIPGQGWGTFGGTIKGTDGVSITKFIFNGSSHNDNTVSGNATFNDSSQNNGGTVSGNATFNDLTVNLGTVSGNATFNGTSYDNNGTISGDATFNDSSFSLGGSVSGTATFNNSTHNNITTISGRAIFNDTSYNDITISGDATFNDSSYNTKNISGDSIFNDSSHNDSSSCGFHCSTAIQTASFFDSSSNAIGVVLGSACFAVTANPIHGNVGTDLGACAVSIPTVTTDSVTVQSSTSVHLFGTITDTGGESLTPAGFQYGRTTSYGTTVSQVGPFVRQTFDNVINSLSCGDYHYRAFATNSAGTGYGDDSIFSTHVCGTATGTGGGTITPPTCTSPQVLVNGACVTPAPTCTSPQILVNGACVAPPPTCVSPKVLVNGVCTTSLPPTCISPQVLQNGTCVTPKPKPVPVTPPPPAPIPAPVGGTTTTTTPRGSSPSTNNGSSIFGSILGTTRNFTNNLVVKTFGNVAVVIPIVFSLLALINSLMSGIPLVNHSFYSSVVLLQLLGFKRKPKPWGTVYDSVTKRPLPFVRVEILNEQSRKLESTITDANGRYGFLISSQLPNIQLRAYLAKYDFPSKRESSVVEQKLYPNIYKGGIVNALSSLANFDLPMDPIDKSTARSFYFGISSIKLNNILTKSADILFVFGTILGITNAIVNPSVFSYSILAVIFISFMLRISGLKLKSFGLTKDVEENKALPFGLITLYNQTGERLNFTVSDDKGRYFLLAPQGNYVLKAYTPSHVSPMRTKEMPISTRKGWISKEIGV